VHEDMMDALEIIKGKAIFTIQMVLDRHQNIYKVAAGDINKAFGTAVNGRTRSSLCRYPRRRMW